MIRSMTGFGQGENSASGWRCTVEVRSVNGRHLEVRLRMPPGLGALEDRLKKDVKARCDRGNIDVAVSLMAEGGEKSAFALNRDLLASYGEMLKEIETVLERPVHISMGDLLSNRDLVRNNSWEDSREAVEALVRETLGTALDGLLTMRESEGAALDRTLRGHTAEVARIAQALKPLAAELPALYAKRLRENLERLLEGQPLPDERIVQEISMFADRCDVSEEFARLETHLDHLHGLWKDGGTVGRKSEFLLQELNREANTLGVKCNDARVGTLIVELKAQLEKLREQIQNIE